MTSECGHSVDKSGYCYECKKIVKEPKLHIKALCFEISFREEWIYVYVTEWQDHCRDPSECVNIILGTLDNSLFYSDSKKNYYIKNKFRRIVQIFIEDYMDDFNVKFIEETNFINEFDAVLIPLSMLFKGFE
jgi:hypothetical protein